MSNFIKLTVLYSNTRIKEQMQIYLNTNEIIAFTPTQRGTKIIIREHSLRKIYKTYDDFFGACWTYNQDDFLEVKEKPDYIQKSLGGKK